MKKQSIAREIPLAERVVPRKGRRIKISQSPRYWGKSRSFSATIVHIRKHWALEHCLEVIIDRFFPVEYYAGAHHLEYEKQTGMWYFSRNEGIPGSVVVKEV